MYTRIKVQVECPIQDLKFPVEVTSETPTSFSDISILIHEELERKGYKQLAFSEDLHLQILSIQEVELA